METQVNVNVFALARKEYEKIHKTLTKNAVLKKIKDTYKLTEAEAYEICKPVKETAPTTKAIVVGAGDWDSKFVRYANRDIDRDYVKKYKQEISSILGSKIYLLDLGNGSYRILDGQHRICSACEVAGEKKTKLKFTDCTVYPIYFFNNEIEICQLITKINFQRNQTNSNTLEIYRHESPWQKRAEVMGVDNLFSFKQRRNSISWTNVIASFAEMKKINEHESMSHYSVRPAERLDIWMNASDEEITDYLAFLQWYYPYANRAQDLYQMVSMYNSSVIAVIGCAYFKYDQDIDVQMNRMLEHAFIAKLKFVTQVRAQAEIILYAMNYKATKNVIELYGVTGRE